MNTLAIAWVVSFILGCVAIPSLERAAKRGGWRANLRLLSLYVGVLAIFVLVGLLVCQYAPGLGQGSERLGLFLSLVFIPALLAGAIPVVASFMLCIAYPNGRQQKGAA